MSLPLLSWCLALCVHAAGPPGATAAAVLTDWDERRSAAWSTTDSRALRALYTPGSPAARRDVEMLSEWRDRGVRVEGLRMQLLSVRVVSERPERLSVDVADRVAGGVVMPGGQSLPRDRVTSHRVVLRKVDGWWLVESVRDHASPLRTTSWTVRSRNE